MRGKAATPSLSKSLLSAVRQKQRSFVPNQKRFRFLLTLPISNSRPNIPEPLYGLNRPIFRCPGKAEFRPRLHDFPSPQNGFCSVVSQFVNDVMQANLGEHRINTVIGSPGLECRPEPMNVNVLVGLSVSKALGIFPADLL